MMDLQLQIGGRAATIEERLQLDELYPLNSHSMTMLKYGPAFEVPLEEDANTTGAVCS